MTCDMFQSFRKRKEGLECPLSPFTSKGGFFQKHEGPFVFETGGVGCDGWTRVKYVSSNSDPTDDTDWASPLSLGLGILSGKDGGGPSRADVLKPMRNFPGGWGDTLAPARRAEAGQNG